MKHERSRRFRTGHTAVPESGFSLLELIVVMTLLVIITIGIVPVYTSAMEGVQARNARTEFVSLLGFVQERAVSESREYRVYIDEDEGSYWVMRLDTVEEDEKIFVPAEETFGGKRYFPEDIKLTSVKANSGRGADAEFIACYASGSSDRAELDFESPAGDFSIVSKGMMGKIEVEK